METFHDQSSDSPSKNSYIGSYYQPPDRILPRPEPPLVSMNTLGISPGLSRTTDDVSSKAVIDALKTLQEKIRRLELERKKAEKNVQRSSQATSSFEHNATSSNGHTPTPHTVPTQNTNKRELVSQLQSAEARCRGLEMQLDYMRRMMEKAEQDKNALAEKQASLQRQTATDCSSLQTQQEKLEKLEKECIKLSQTQSQAWRKMSFLEQKLVAEEHERRLVQEKADELQREMDINLRLSSPPSEELKPKKKSGRPSASKPSSEPLSQSYPTGRRLPFVAGTSTSPSHSVHANMQSLLHMLKHHQPQLCNHVRSLHRPRGGARKSLRRALTTASPETAGPRRVAQSLGSLSDLLLALQDELGQMGFEHQELVHQMEETPGRETTEDLERELESLLKKMEDKGVQITKLRQHQQTVRLLTQNRQGQAAGGDSRGPKASGASPPPQPSPVREERPGGRRGGAAQSSLQVLKETQRLRNSLKTDDISWET